VELVVEFPDARQLSLLDRRLDQRLDGGKLREILIGEMRKRELEGEFLEGGPDEANFCGLFGGDRDDARATVGRVGDDPLALELAERFPHWRHAQVEALGEFSLR